MVSALKIDVFLSMLSVVVQSKDGDLVALEGDSEAVDIPKLCRLDLQELAEASQPQLDLEASAVVSVEDLAVLLVVAAFGEVSEVVTVAVLLAEEVASDTKVEAGLVVVEEVGTAADRPMAIVMAKQHPQMHLPALAEIVEALAVVMAALPSTVV